MHYQVYAGGEQLLEEEAEGGREACDEKPIRDQGL